MSLDDGIDPLAKPLAVIVQNSSPDIKYSGSWTQTASSAFLDLTQFGDLPFSDQLYKAPTGKASIKYTFTGTTKLQVRGTVINTKTSPSKYDIGCDVSPRQPRVASEASSLDGGEENNWVFCELRNLSPDITYTLAFDTDITSGSPIFVDRLVLLPAQNFNLANALINVEHRNPLIQYDSSWKNENGAAHLPTKGSAKAKINFVGTSATLYGAYQSRWGNGENTASYSIDGNPPQSFIIPAMPANYKDIFVEDALFKTPQLTAGNHTIEITAPGSISGSRPLAIGKFVIQNAVAAPGTGGSSSVVSSTASSTSTTQTGSITSGSSTASPVSSGTTINSNSITAPSPSSITLPSGSSITPTSSQSSDTGVPSSNNNNQVGATSSDSELSSGAKAAIGVSVSVGALLLIALVAFLVMRRKKAKRALKEDDEGSYGALRS